MLIAGVVGISIGTLMSAFLRPKYPSIDPLIIGGGLFLAGFMLLAAFWTAARSITISLFFTFVGTTFACLNWAVVVDMSLYVVPAAIRSTSTGLQTAIAHGFGDAGSPYVVGLIADALKQRNHTGHTNAAHVNSTLSSLTCSTDVDDAISEFSSMQGALWITVAMTFLSALIFMVISRFVVSDRKKASAGNNIVEATSSGVMDTIDY